MERALARREYFEALWKRAAARTHARSLMNRSQSEFRERKELLEEMFDLFPVEEFASDNIWYHSLREDGWVRHDCSTGEHVKIRVENASHFVSSLYMEKQLVNLRPKMVLGGFSPEFLCVGGPPRVHVGETCRTSNECCNATKHGETHVCGDHRLETRFCGQNLHVRNIGISYFEWEVPGAITWSNQLLPGKCGLARISGSVVHVSLLPNTTILIQILPANPE